MPDRDISCHAASMRLLDRFGAESAGILIGASEKQADWLIAAETEASLKEAVATVRHLDGVGHGLSFLGKRGPD